MQINILEPACSHPMCLIERGPSKRVDIPLICNGDDDHIIIQNTSITYNILATTLTDTKLSCSSFRMLIHNIDVFLVVFARYDHYVFPGESPTTSMTFSSHYQLYKHLWKRLGVRSSKLTHCHHPRTSIRLQQMQGADSDIAHLTLWLRNAQHTQYQLLISPNLLVKKADFQNQHCYFLWWADLDPEK